MTLNACHMSHSAMGYFSQSSNSVNLPFLIYNVFTVETLHHAVTLTSDPFTLNACIGCHVVKLYTKFERNWTIRSWVIDDLTNFHGPFSGAPVSQLLFSEGSGPNYAKFGEDINLL